MEIPKDLEHYVNSLCEEAKEERNELDIENALEYLEYINTNLDAQVESSLKTLGWTSLMICVSIGVPTFVLAGVISKDSDVNATAEDGGTALMVAAFFGHSEVVRFLLEEGAEIDAVDNQGNTALMHAVMRGRRDMVKLLLEKGANANISNSSGTTAMKHAEFRECTDIAELLGKAGTPE